MGRSALIESYSDDAEHAEDDQSRQDEVRVALAGEHFDGEEVVLGHACPPPVLVRLGVDRLREVREGLGPDSHLHWDRLIRASQNSINEFTKILFSSMMTKRRAVRSTMLIDVYILILSFLSSSPVRPRLAFEARAAGRVCFN